VIAKSEKKCFKCVRVPFDADARMLSFCVFVRRFGADSRSLSSVFDFLVNADFDLSFFLFTTENTTGDKKKRVMSPQ